MKKLVVYFFLSISIYSQDSLYLVGTITGASTQKNITNITRVGDVNGDGYDDFMVSSRTGKTRSDQGIVQLYLGSSTLDLTPDVTFHYPCCDTLNNLWNANELGDVNGDGYDDFSLSGKFGDFGFSKGKVFLYYGGVTIDTVPFTEFYEPWIQDDFGDVVEKVGDINKDGYDDFIICSSYNWTSLRGYAYLFWGGDTIDWDRIITFTSGTLEDFFGTSAANIGDINNDGFEDIAISATAWLSSNDTSKVYIFYGGKPMDNEYDTILTGNNGSDEIGKVIKRCGDINNDSNIDFIIGTSGSCESISLYLNIDSMISFVGYPYIGTDGDMNKDGFTDFVIGNPYYQNSNNIVTGAAFIYLGKNSIDTNYNYILEGETGSEFGTEFSTALFFEDINGDEYDEIFIFAPNYSNFENRTGKIYIYSYNKLSDVEDNKDTFLINFELNQNYPNPFNPSTTISYQLPKTANVTLKVYDVLGKEIVTLVNEEKSSGSYKVEFNGSALASGIYYYQIKSGEFIQTKKMILMK